ncbi:SRPBCC family protein [Actinopolymorpha alba]|uniref:SRPBCC family protein n=1 Tax=Actinopolymorpha alba TaxID=533267 RepID=UPI000382B5B4|nr:SRPBCC family protein [Actinopolymorpha alba]
MNATLHTVDGRCVLRFERRLAHPAEKIWRAITDSAELAQWFPSGVKMDFEAGTIWFEFGKKEGAPGTGTVLETDPPRLLAFTWETDTLRFELQPDAGTCLLTFTYTFDDRYSAASLASGWDGCLSGLEAMLDGQPYTWPDGLGERHEEYIERFGLAEGTIQETADGYEIRFERQLIRPVDAVWAFLLEHAESEAPKPTDSDVAVGGQPPLRLTNGYVPAGSVTVVKGPEFLEYAWLHEGVEAGRVRWQLSPGAGGARLVLTQTLPSMLADQRATALAAWHTHVEILADWLKGAGRCWPEGRTEELTKHYLQIVG